MNETITTLFEHPPPLPLYFELLEKALEKFLALLIIALIILAITLAACTIYVTVECSRERNYR